MVKLLTALAFAGLFSGTVIAQTTTAPPPPAGPTAIQCREGWKDGMPWNKEAFEAACAKLRQSEKP